MYKQIEPIKQKFTKIQVKIALYSSLVLFLSISIFQGLNSRWLTQQGDAAGFVDSLAGDQPALKLNFTYGLSFTRLRELWSNPSNLPPLSPFSNNYEEVSFFEIHPYIFSYFFRWIPQPFPEIQWAPLFILATSYAIGITLLLKYLKARPISSFNIALVLITMGTSPILVESMRGQPYFDKLFFGPCIALILTLYFKDVTKTSPRILVLFMLIMLQSLSERASLMSSTVALLILTIKYKSNVVLNRQILQITVLSLIGICWYFVWIRNFSANTDLNNLALSYYYHNLKETFFGDRRNSLIVLLVSLIPIILLTFGKLRFLFFGFAFILPNLLVTVGGAELTGFQTHYHSLYLPIILSFAVIAVSHSYSSGKVGRTSKFLIPVSLCLSLVANGTYGHYVLGLEDHKMNMVNTGARILDAYGLTPRSIEKSRRSKEQAMLKSIKELEVKENARISAPEIYMPTLTNLGFRTLDYFPIGIGDNDIIIVPFLDDMGQELDILFYGQLPQENVNTWSERIFSELDKDYVRLNFFREPFGNFAIYSKR